MMLGAPLAPLSFPATDRPSAGFLTRFERALRAVPDDALGAPMSLALNGCVEESFADCLVSMGETAHHVVVSIGGAHGLIAIPDATLHAMIEFAYGGDNSEPATRVPAPSRLAARFGYRMASALADAIALTLAGAEISVLGATDVPAEAVAMKAPALACGFAISARGQSVGAIGLCVPLQALARIETTASGPLVDEAWQGRLERAIAGTRLNIRCVLARPTLSAGEVARLVPGAVIPIPNLNEVALIAGGYRIATGAADACDGRAAVVINRTEFMS